MRKCSKWKRMLKECENTIVAWAEWLEYDAAKSRVNASASWNRECNGSLKHGMKGVELRGTKEKKEAGIWVKNDMKSSPRCEKAV